MERRQRHRPLPLEIRLWRDRRPCALRRLADLLPDLRRPLQHPPRRQPHTPRPRSDGIPDVDRPTRLLVVGRRPLHGHARDDQAPPHHRRFTLPPAPLRLYPGQRQHHARPRHRPLLPRRQIRLPGPHLRQRQERLLGPRRRMGARRPRQSARRPPRRLGAPLLLSRQIPSPRLRRGRPPAARRLLDTLHDGPRPRPRMRDLRHRILHLRPPLGHQQRHPHR